MGFTITDGTGEGFEAKVDRDNRIYTQAVTRTELTNAILNGNGYNLTTGLIELTSDSQSALGYIKNNSEFPLVFQELLFIINASSGGTGNSLISIVKNPTTGTIITSADTNVSVTNRNFGSSKTINGDIYKGAEGVTITDGSNFATSTRDASFADVVTFDAAPIVLERGNSIGVTFTPPSGNVSQNVVLAATCFVETLEI